MRQGLTILLTRVNSLSKARSGIGSISRLSATTEISSARSSKKWLSECGLSVSDWVRPVHRADNRQADRGRKRIAIFARLRGIVTSHYVLSILGLPPFAFLTRLTQP